MTTATYPGVGPDGVYRLHEGLDAAGTPRRRVLPPDLSSATLYQLTNGGNVLSTKEHDELRKLREQVKRNQWERDNQCDCGLRKNPHFKGDHK